MAKALTAAYIEKMLPIWRTDPIAFFKDVIPKFVPTDQQREICLAIAKPNAWVSVKSGHGVGKTSLLANLALWFISCFDDCKVPVTSPSKEQLKSTMWGELRKWHGYMEEPFKSKIEITIEKVTIVGRENSFIQARTARKENPDALQGFHAKNLLFLVDEASGVDKVIFEVAMGALTTDGARFLLTGNPTKNNGFFYDSFQKSKKGEKRKWVNFTLSSIDSPNVKPDFAAEMAAQYGEDSNEYRVRVLGEFPDEGNMQFIGRDLVDCAVRRWFELTRDPELYESKMKVLGVDVARYGDDKTCLVLRQGLYSRILHVIPRNSLSELTKLIVKEHRKRKFKRICVDVGGLGAGVVDNLLDLKLPVEQVNFGENAEDTERYKYRRTEIWARMKEWLERGGIESNEDLIEDLVAPEYSFTPKVQIELESKDSLKRRLKHSPDIGDALALTFADETIINADYDEDCWIEGEGNVVTDNDVELFDYYYAS